MRTDATTPDTANPGRVARIARLIPQLPDMAPEQWARVSVRELDTLERIVADKASQSDPLDAIDDNAVKLQLHKLRNEQEARRLLAEGTRPTVDGSMFKTGGSFILDIPDVTPTVWGDGSAIAWAEGEALMIAGPQGLGKTTTLGMLVRAQLRCGGHDSVLDLPVAACAGRILYLAMDRPQQAARSLARQFSPEDRGILDERLRIWQGPPPADIARNPDILTELADAADAEVVYVDSLKDAALGLSDDEVGAGYNRARQKLLASGRQLAELHHTVKRGANGGAPATAADVYGSTWLTAGAGSVILLSGEPGDPIVGLRHVKKPAEEIGPLMLNHDQATGEITVHHAHDLLAMAKASGASGLTTADVAVALWQDEFKKGTKRERESLKAKARRRLDKLADSGELVRMQGTRQGQEVVVYFPVSPGAAEVDNATA